MIRFLPISSYEQTKLIYEAQAVPFTAPAFAILADDSGRAAGGCLFLLREATAELLHFWTQDEGDAYLLDGLFRAALNFALNRGIKTAHVSKNALDILLPHVPAAGHLANGGFDIGEFFNKKCKN
ncbi:MAG TPA: hypothetical protein DEQ02_06705 [Ruminococcaceae bacterium]|nr:hypothetical protein [Oscillospiraceae bacterium]